MSLDVKLWDKQKMNKCAKHPVNNSDQICQVWQYLFTIGCYNRFFSKLNKLGVIGPDNVGLIVYMATF
ncbi:hypothetical protein D3C76_1254000 [compost metagenome]